MRAGFLLALGFWIALGMLLFGLFGQDTAITILGGLALVCMAAVIAAAIWLKPPPAKPRLPGEEP